MSAIRSSYKVSLLSANSLKKYRFSKNILYPYTASSTGIVSILKPIISSGLSFTMGYSNPVPVSIPLTGKKPIINTT